MSNPIKNYMTPMPHTIGHDMTISKANKLMQQYSCHHLPVFDGGTLVGIISDRDVRTFASIKGAEQTLIEEIMTDKPVMVENEMDVYQVAMLMHQKKIGSVIVKPSSEIPWGIFTATDALSYFVEKNNSTSASI